MMMKIVRLIKKLFGVYETGYEYWVNTSEIKVDPEWRKTNIGRKKFARKLDYWNANHEFESRIILDSDFNLIDGYSSLVIAEMINMKHVPVYFV